MPHDRPQEKDKARRIGAAIAVAALAWIIYASTLSAGFVWDDHNLVEMQPENPGLADFTRLWTSDFWLKTEGKSGSRYYRPLTSTTFLVDRVLYGKDPAGYHFTNLVIYSALCIMACSLFRKLLPSHRTALLAGLLFAAHPAHTENVAWVSGRTDLVCALFMLAAFYAYLQADRSGDKKTWAAALVLFALSLLGKEMSITMVAAVPVHSWLEHRKIKQAALRAVPFLAVAAAFWALHSAAAPHVGEENIYTAPAAYAGNVIRNLALGLWHCLVPGGFHYLVTATREEAARFFALPSWPWLAAMAAAPALVAAGSVLAAVKKRNLAALGLSCALIAILPVSGLVPIGVVFALRFLLIPSFFAVLVAAAALAPLDSKTIGIGGIEMNAALLAGIPVVILYAGISMARTPEWKSDVTLMQSAIEHEPGIALAHFLLGNGLAEQGELSEAAEHYKRALEQRPGYIQAEYNLGVVLERMGETGQAERHYRSVLRNDPHYLQARKALTRILLATGRKQEAMRLLREAERIFQQQKRGGQ